MNNGVRVMMAKMKPTDTTFSFWTKKWLEGRRLGRPARLSRIANLC